MPAERRPPVEDDEMPPRPMWPDAFVTTTADLRAALVLSGLRGITPRKLIAVAAERGSASATLAAIRRGSAGSENDRAFARTVDGEEISAAVDSCGARIVPWGSAEYPAQLVNIHDPPAVLYVIGRPAPDPTRAVAVVGARRCTELGRELGASIGRALALAGVVVVSGAARGIDTAAHDGALDAGGTTLAVMGCGIDTVYPAGSRALVRRIGATGTVLSEYPPGTPPVQRNFPARNRIVAGLCGATVVVEGAKGSGSMISAEHAMEFGRDVYAVPGAVTNPLAEVPLQLIRDGATMIRGAEDLLHELGLELVAEQVVERLEISEDERRALAELTGPTLPDRVAAALGITIPHAVSLLMRLELRGLVRGVGGRYESTLKAGAASG
jgi:DNA processing protein